MSDQASMEAARQAAENVRAVIVQEVETIRKSGRYAAWIPVLGSLVAAGVGASGTFFATRGKLDELAVQARNAADLTAYQKLFDAVLATDKHETLQHGLAVLILADLVDSKRQSGLCRYLVSMTFDGRLRADDPDPTTAECRTAAGRVLSPQRPGAATTGGTVAAVVAVASAAAKPAGAAPTPAIPAAWVKAIEDLGSDAAADRLSAAATLSRALNDGTVDLPRRIALFAALVETTELDLYRRLTVNGRYNTFVVLSEIRPFIDAARNDPLFREAAARLARNAGILRESSDPEMMGAATRRQVEQTLSRLPRDGR